MNYDSIILKANFDGVNFVDFSDDVIGGFDGGYGIDGNDFLDRIGSGNISFVLNNSYSNSSGLIGYYCPGNVNCRSGFAIGLDIQLIITLDGCEEIKFQGKIPKNGISVNVDNPTNSLTTVIANIWIEQAANHELVLPEITTNVDISDVSAVILANMDTQPPAVTYNNGANIFATAFDLVKTTTTALVEFMKLVISEIGYIYQNRHGLIIEGQYTRDDTKSTVTLMPDNIQDELLLETGDNLLLETGDKFLLNTSQSASFTDEQISGSVPTGKNIYNRLKFTYYPREITDGIILFSIGERIFIDPGTSKVIYGTFTHTGSTYRTLTATNVVTTFVVGYGDIDSVELTEEIGASSIKYTITNNWTQKIRVDTLYATGDVIETDTANEVIVSDSVSLASMGVSQLNANMDYQNTSEKIDQYAPYYLSLLKNEDESVDEIFFIANKNYKNLASFLYLEPGDRIHLELDMAGINEDFFIQYVSFSIVSDLEIYFSWVVKKASLDTFNNFCKYNINVFDDGSVFGF